MSAQPQMQPLPERPPVVRGQPRKLLLGLARSYDQDSSGGKTGPRLRGREWISVVQGERMYGLRTGSGETAFRLLAAIPGHLTGSLVRLRVRTHSEAGKPLRKAVEEWQLTDDGLLLAIDLFEMKDLLRRWSEADRERINHKGSTRKRVSKSVQKSNPAANI